jgi:CspA family cold shock protein
MIGIVKRWVGDRGFGFIAPLASDASGAAGADVFVHISACGGLQELTPGDRVSYDEERDPRTGKSRAGNVRLVGRAE